MTSDPAQVDAVVKRAWQEVYNGMKGCIDEAVDTFLEKYKDYVLKLPSFEMEKMEANMVYESFQRTKESAAALDGWNPKELSLLSLITCLYIAIMFQQIEAGAPWPKATRHALIAYLEKEGAEIGHVMSFRCVTITAPFYRA